MSERAEVCLLNIGPKERQKRLRFGAIAFVIAVLATAGLVAGGLALWWRVLLFLPFAGATTGFFQARRRT